MKGERIRSLMATAAVNVLQILIGLAGGLTVGSGTVAFLIALDIIPRLAQLTNSYRNIHWFEGAVVSGSLFWTFVDFFDVRGMGTPVGAVCFGLLSGCFIGLLAAALTEVINVLPILAKRLGMSQYIGWLLAAMVIGKVLGSLFEWLVYR